ncbi:RNA polymerase sigma factor [Microtetraspora malaysiensis]|uniref:RNA polymerase sigma factor n=1 Tax=Microtetraspora malaysiensis TaxID=161358 RepID=UPI00083364F8|nr:RNA polymerase sigma factor [Microtetraspora malaysiensis]
MTPEEAYELHRCRKRALAGAVYGEQHDPLLGYARRLASGWGIPMSELDPEDVVQDAFVQLILQDGIETIHKPGAWLCVVVRNQIAKAAQRRRPFTEGDPALHLEAGTACWSSLARQADIEDIRAARTVVDAIADLSGNQQIATYLSRVQGWPNTDIAAFLDCSVSTAGVHVFRGTHAISASPEVMAASRSASFGPLVVVLVGLVIAIVLFLAGASWWLAVLVPVGLFLGAVASSWLWYSIADWLYDRRIRRRRENS